MSPTLITALFIAFDKEASCAPPMTLRAGNAIDDYAAPMPFDPRYDEISNEYLESFHWGLSYLDSASWRHYLPHLFQYAFHNIHTGSVVTDALLNSLRPPERTPPRLSSLSHAQEIAIRHSIEHLAFAEESADAELACQILEEWWLPNSIYRPINQ